MSDRAHGVVPTPHRFLAVIVALALGVASLLVATVVSAPAADAAAPELSRVATASAAVKGKRHTIRVPRTVEAGDRLVMFMTWKSTTKARRVRGWSTLEAHRGKGIRAQAWTRVATTRDAGRRVRVVTRRSASGVLAVTAYRSTGDGADVTSSAKRGSNRRGKTHRTPAIRVSDPGSWLLSVWGVTARRGPGWRPPASVETRAARSTRGRGRVSMLVADSAGAVRTGRLGGRKARTRNRADRSAMFSVVVSPGTADVPEPGNSAPKAAFTFTCDELVCDFDAKGSSDPDGDTLTYAWEFGDGETATGVAPSHTYADAGTRTVTLTVADGEANHKATKSVATSITPPPNSPPTALFAYSCTSKACSFDAGDSSDPDGDEMTYAWDFGDGGTSTEGPSTSHTYGSFGTRDVKLTVSAGAHSDEATMSVATANTPPQAVFTATCVKLDCDFDATGSSDVDGDSLTYAWDFGDDETAAGATTSHSYDEYDTRDVTLTVSDGTENGELAKAVTTVNLAPIATFTYSCDDLACDFDASGTRDLDDEATTLTYEWNFGDGTAGTGVTESHTYADEGPRTVTLTVGDTVNFPVKTDVVEPTITLPPDGTDPQPTPNHGDRLPPDTANRNMPLIEEGEIWDIEVLGDRAFATGTFSSVTDTAADGTPVLNRAGIVAFDLNTGEVDLAFNPTFGGGGVRTVEATPDGTKLFVGGTFNSVNGVNMQGVASLDLTTGEPLTGFDFTGITNNQVQALAATDDTLYVGGRFSRVNGVFRTGLAAVDTTSGAVDTEFENNLSGGIGVNGQLGVQELRLTHDNARLLVVHTARQIAGQDRYGVALIGTVSKQLLPWKTRLWQDNLQYVGGINRIYAGAIAPDDSYFVVSSGSGGDRPPINDTAVAFSFDSNNNVQPLWISRAFDSIYSLAITEQAVYIGGHFQFNESPTAPVPWPGLDNEGYGTGQGLSGYSLGDAVVRRDHLGALNPTDGTALEWHPGSNSYEGNKAMLATEHGLITGGDAMRQGGGRVGRIAFFDFDDLPGASDPDTTITTPIQGRVVAAEEEFVIEGTATSTAPLNRVQVEVKSGSQFLQADMTWGGDFYGFDAVLGAQAGDVTQWSLPVTVPDSREVTVLAKTFADGGSDPSKAEKKIESFLFGDLPPSTRISSPGWGCSDASTSFVMRGSATDDFGVNGVSLYIQEFDGDGFLTEDGELVDEYTTFRIEPDLPGSVDTTWQYEVNLPHEGEWKFGAMAVDTAGQSDTRWDTRECTVSATGQPPTLTIAEPVAVTPPVVPPTLEMTPGGPLTFTGTAADDEALAAVEVSLRNDTTGESLSADGSWGPDVYAGWFSGWHRISPASLNAATYDWSFTMPDDLKPGVYEFGVRATDQQGRSTPRGMGGEVTINVTVPGDAPPDGLLDVTGTQTLDVMDLDLTGTATDDFGVDRVLVAIVENETDRYLQPDGSLQAAFATHQATLAAPGGTSTTWSLPVDLPGNGDYSVTVRAVDGSDQYDPSMSGATARYLAFPGDAAPTLSETLASPPDGQAFTEARIFVSGRAEDDNAIGGVEVAIVNELGEYLGRGSDFGSSERWNDAFLNSPGSLASNYSYTSPILPDGAYQVLVRPVDTHGLYPEPRVANVTVTGPAGNTAPVAAGTVTCVENVCTFDGRASTDNNVATLSYEWDFGDGDDDDNALTTYTYTEPGVFTPALTVTDEYGLESILTLDPITIVEPSGNQAPTAVSTTPTCVGLVCNFSGDASTDPNEEDDLEFSWDFGDGVGTDDDSDPSYTFLAAGTYTVTLTATDGWGRTGTDTVTVTVAP